MSVPSPSRIFTPEDIDAVFGALCLAGSARRPGWLADFMRHMEQRRASGAWFQPGEVGSVARTLVAAGRALLAEDGSYSVPRAQADAWLTGHLEPALAARALPAWARTSTGYPPGSPQLPPPNIASHDEEVAYARLLLHAGLGKAAFERERLRAFDLGSSASAVATAAMSPFLPARFEQIDPALRSQLLQEWARQFGFDAPLWLPLLHWLDDRVGQAPEQLPLPARQALAGWHLERGDAEHACAVIEGSATPWDDLLRAGGLSVRGRWVESAEAFARAHRALQTEQGLRNGLLDGTVLRLYLLALLAQEQPKAWTAARKLALAEAGKRQPPARGWGLWAHAVAARLGDVPTEQAAFKHVEGWAGVPHRENADRLLLAAWLGMEPGGWRPAEVQALVDHFEANRRTLWADLVRQAAARFGWTVPPHTRSDPAWPVALFMHRREAWRDALAAIAALGESGGPEAKTLTEPVLRWQMTLDPVGRVVEIEPFELPANPRSRARPKPVPLSRLARSTRLDARDAAVARCIAKTAQVGAPLGLDVVAAAMALVQHPGVTLADQPEQPVELREALPELEVRRLRGDDGREVFEFHLPDPLLTEDPPRLGLVWAGTSWAVEQERRNSLRVLRDDDERARLIRITPAQRRVIELVSQRWAVPVDARAELDAALRVLAGHFQLHSDAAAGQDVPSDARLHAQLVPRGEALQLRLVVRPFGSFGPAVPPGYGRPRLLTVHEGLQLSTERAIRTELGHLGEVLEALPFLQDAGAASADEASWTLEDPQQALHVLEVLPTLPGVAALEWPRGKPVRVVAAPAQALTLKVHTARDWFAIDGELRLDEGRVIGLQRLMDLAQASRQGRFVALGEGEYLALTERLRAQLADLQALSRPGDDGLRLPLPAAAFLGQVLEGTASAGDAAWAERVARLDEAASLQAELPRGLQAELRDYQAEGYRWLVRSAHAGLGVVLADDMGLGKTVQTLALLVARAPLGPALVIAPTSVCANWVAEAARFAPGLRVQAFGEGDRGAMLESAGPGDLVVASYGLTLIEGEAFAARSWATLVLDEAQALKNAATQRARAISALPADFRLALSGTPVENRLADLWSIMNLLNPGLLGTAQQFNERFATPIERYRDEAARARLRRLIGPLLLRRTKAQVLGDLPPRTEIVHRVEPGTEERVFLEAARRSALERVAGLDSADPQAAFHVLAELTRLRRAACDPRLAAPELGLVGAKAQEFERLATELVAGRHKALVFSQFTDFLDLLAERLHGAGIAHQVLTGATPAAERARRVAAFQAGQGELFLISLKAGGFGLNLTAADYVIIADPWWNPAAEDQASGRAHRIGQQRPVTVYRLVTAGSIEERIVDLHRHKRELADGILEGQDQARPMGAEALRALLRGE